MFDWGQLVVGMGNIIVYVGRIFLHNFINNWRVNYENIIANIAFYHDSSIN